MITFTEKIWLMMLFTITVYGQENRNNYGPYKIRWNKFETCKGPKRTDCGTILIENTQNMSHVIFKVDFKVDCPVTMTRISLSSKHNNCTSKLFNYSFDRLCEHFAMGPVLVDVFNTTRSCVIKKGKYEAHLNINEGINIFLGTNFFYGNYELKMQSFNKSKNFFCLVIVMSTERLSAK